VDVYADNLLDEISRMSELLHTYNYVSMDTEFPGVVYHPYEDTKDYQYQLVKANADRLKIIQLGISLADENGNLPAGVSTWQFNFEFDLDNDESSKDSIELLLNAGIDFQRLKTHGIPVHLFAEHIMTSGLVLNEDIHWVCFHSAYDFGYFLRCLLAHEVPTTEKTFRQDLALYFPNILDIKYIKKDFDVLKGGLNRLAEYLDIVRIGPVHQAGSDSLITGAVFFRLRDSYFGGKIDKSLWNKISGLRREENQPPALNDNYSAYMMHPNSSNRRTPPLSTADEFMMQFPNSIPTSQPFMHHQIQTQAHSAFMAPYGYYAGGNHGSVQPQFQQAPFYRYSLNQEMVGGYVYKNGNGVQPLQPNNQFASRGFAERQPRMQNYIEAVSN